jgi:hypothetical protein
VDSELQGVRIIVRCRNMGLGGRWLVMEKGIEGMVMKMSVGVLCGSEVSV